MKQILAKIMCAIGCDGCPESTGYILCESNMELWQVVRDALIRADLVTVSNGHFMTLTTKGTDIVYGG